MKLYISPEPPEVDYRAAGGIWSVIRAQAQHLPAYGVEIVSDLHQADIVSMHAGDVVDTSLPIVASNHGMYWTGDFDWGHEYWMYNNPVIEVLRRAHRIIVPSEWVALPIKRDMRKTPVVIPHGIDGREYSLVEDHGGYVLWGKPRVDVVSDPAPVNNLAQMAPKVQFRTTYGRPTANVEVTGHLPFEDFQHLISHAAMWLATTRETGDIASREAMAWGVPVLAWDWGGTSDLVRHKETGWLAPPGNYESLLEGLHYILEHRDTLGRAARDDVLARFDWKDIMGLYARVYEDVLTADSYPVDISVVIPTYNYAEFLPECLDSIINAPLAATVEVIVVDDASTDHTQAVLANYDSLNVMRHTTNQGLPAALNSGHRVARGKYITNLDADNYLVSEGLQELYNALEAKPWLDVATGPYLIHDRPDVNGGPVSEWDQMNHYNQIPSTCLMRSRSIKPFGGYRERQLKNEDGEFWCRGMSAGLRCEKVTDTPVFTYRWHGENKSIKEQGEDNPEGPLSWNFYFPWRKNHDITPFGMLGHPEMGSWAVRSYDNPHIAVVIPCGPGHESYLVDALDSVAGQTFTNTECIVANDTGKPLDVAAMGHPWVRVVDTAGRQGPAVARNTAISQAKAPLIVPLDADDLLYPRLLEFYYQAWLQYPESLVYSDCEIEDIPGKRYDYPSGPWSWEKISHEAIYQDTILFAKQWWEAVGGYPVDQPYGWWEDWLFGVKLHLIGIGASYVKEPWGVYRHWTAGDSGRSKNDLDNADFGSPEFKAKYQECWDWIRRKEIDMACRGCGGKRKTRVVPRKLTVAAATGEDIVVVYDGERTGGFTMNSRAVPGRKYYIEKGVPIVLPAGDMHVLQLPGFRQMEKRQEDAVPEYPPVPPEAPMVTLDKPQGPPVTSIVEEVETPVKSKGNGLTPLGKVPRVSVESLVAAGFKTMDDVRYDLKENKSRRLMSVKGVGPSTLKRIRQVALA